MSAAINLDPKSAGAYHSRGTADLHGGNVQAALADYDRAIELNPKEGYYHLDRGIASYYSGARQKARDDFAAATALDAANPYFAIWLDIADRRDHQPSHLAVDVPNFKMDAWPAPLVQVFLGEITPAAALAAANDADADKQRGQICEANLYSAELARIGGDVGEALPRYRAAAAECPHNFTEWTAALAALNELGAPAAPAK